MIDDRNRELSTVLSYLVGRKVGTNEIVRALGVSRSTYYYMARDDGRLACADNLIKLAKALGLNPVDLLVRYGYLTDDAVAEYLEAEAAARERPQRESRLARLQPRLDKPPI